MCICMKMLRQRNNFPAETALAEEMLRGSNNFTGFPGICLPHPEIGSQMHQFPSAAACNAEIVALVQHLNHP